MKGKVCLIYGVLIWIGLHGIASAELKLSSSFKKVILISVDTLRADYLGCYNPKMKTTPELDQFAHENILCRNVTSQAATTAPSHKSIFYSLYPSIHKTSIRAVPEEKGTSPMELVQAQGFKTAAFTGGGQLSRSFGFARGFDTYWEPQKGTNTKQDVKETEKLAFDWLENHSNDKFFLFLHTFEVHCPYNPPESFFQKWSAWYQGQVQKETCYPDLYLGRRPFTADYQYIQSLYSAEVNYVDNFLGHLFQKLKNLGIYDQTLIVFLSDHGESLGEHGYIGHNQVYDVQLHVPLILHVPGMTSEQINAPIESLDVMPTIFELLGIDSQKASFQGRSLMPLIRKKENFDENRPLISEEIGRVRVRIGDWALIFAPDKSSHEELYHLKLDPLELRNLAKQDAKRVEQMKIPYNQMMLKSKVLSAQFVLDPAKKPHPSEEAREQLKALGYIGH
jgi:arylsulfatase A-like enzyme